MNIEIVPPTEKELWHVSAASRWLCTLEGKIPLPRAKSHAKLQRLQAKGAIILVARAPVQCERLSYCGCIMAVLVCPGVALVGDLVTEPFAPPGAALCLMAQVVRECRARGCVQLLLTAGTEKNKTRHAYSRIGFQSVGFFVEGAAVLAAEIDDVERGLEKRLRRGRGLGHG